MTMFYKDGIAVNELVPGTPDHDAALELFQLSKDAPVISEMLPAVNPRERGVPVIHLKEADVWARAAYSK